MLHDEDVYFDPERFFPCRFEGPDPAPDPRILTYGFGRRYEFYLPDLSAHSSQPAIQTMSRTAFCRSLHILARLKSHNVVPNFTSYPKGGIYLSCARVHGWDCGVSQLSKSVSES